LILEIVMPGRVYADRTGTEAGKLGGRGKIHDAIVVLQSASNETDVGSIRTRLSLAAHHVDWALWALARHIGGQP
jgi:hypothetical protein